MKNKKTVITITSIVAVLLVIIGVTYAYWLVTKTQTNQNVISSGCLDISLSGEKNDIELQDQFPLSDEDGMKLTPYEFTVTNNCTTSVDYQVNLESIGDSSTAIKASAIKVALNNDIRLLTAGGTEEPTISGAYESNKLGSGTLASKGEAEATVTYDLRIWIDKDAPISEQNKTYRSKISVTVGQGVFNPYKEGTLAYSILSNYGGADSIEKVTDFSTGTTESDAGLYKAQDDLGTSYYFRGAPTNNYVKFGIEEISEEVDVTYYIKTWDYYTFEPSFELIATGDGTYYTSQEECDNSTEFEYLKEQYTEHTLDIYCRPQFDTKTVTQTLPIYWRIVRINGDGTIRLVYDGNNAVANGVAHQALIGDGFYVFDYNGYTWENNGVQVDSEAKKQLEKWYAANLEEKYDKYVADGIFCNDREIIGYSEPYMDPWTETGPYVDPIYGASKRVNSATPKLICPNKSDRYTISGNLGNGLFNKPIGLLSADEALMAGSVLDQKNNTYYLYSGDYYALSTPTAYYYSDRLDLAYLIDSDGSIGSMIGGADLIRPVINLKADVKFTGNGRIDTNTPYEIVMD